jgi:hypothetical protein
VAALTGVGAALRARRGGRALAIGGQALACAEAKGPEQVDHDGHGLGEHVVTDAGAEVTQVALAWNVGRQASQLPVAAPCGRLGQLVAAASVIDLRSQCGGHCQDDEAGWGVAVLASRALVGGTERAGAAEGERGPDEPTEAAFDVALPRQDKGTRGECIMSEPPAGRLRNESHADLTVVRIEGLGMGDKRVAVKGSELLVAKR